jgi:hypothetical protein
MVGFVAGAGRAGPETSGRATGDRAVGTNLGVLLTYLETVAT